MLFGRPRSADVSCGEATLRTHPSSGQASTSSLRRHRRFSSCHSGAALCSGEIEIKRSRSIYDQLISGYGMVGTPFTNTGENYYAL